MFKKNKTLFIFVLVVLLLIIALGVYVVAKKVQARHFLSQLKGEIVYLGGNSDKDMGVYKIKANGADRVLLYKDRTCRNPQWSKDGKKIYFSVYDKETNKLVYGEMDSNGGNVKFDKNPPVDYTLWETTVQRERERDILIEKGDVYVMKNNKYFKVYNSPDPYQPDFHWGATEASWSPDKKYVLFNGDYGLTIADTEGRWAVLTDGANGDWKE